VPALAGKHSKDVLEGWGIEAERVAAFLSAGAVAQELRAARLASEFRLKYGMKPVTCLYLFHLN